MYYKMAIKRIGFVETFAISHKRVKGQETKSKKSAEQQRAAPNPPLGSLQ
ncbi:MAG: hypothetical protein UIH27_00685 [Ruminococcus sp.]|nr:hypothetical protein [Ruminococcus sp.]